MEALLKQGCIYPLQLFPPIPGMKIRATKCGLTSDVMHVVMPHESEFGNRLYALAVLFRDHKWKTEALLHSFVRDMDRWAG